MANNLSAFFAQNAKKAENIFVKVSERFVDENGEPIKWEIQGLTGEENQKLRKSCLKRIPVPGKKNQYTQDVDTAAYQAKLAVKSVVFPDLNDTQLQSSYGVMGAEQLVGTMLLAGEYDVLIAAILDFNGFDGDGGNSELEKELEEEAKN